MGIRACVLSTYARLSGWKRPKHCFTQSNVRTQDARWVGVKRPKYCVHTTYIVHGPLRYCCIAGTFFASHIKPSRLIYNNPSSFFLQYCGKCWWKGPCGKIPSLRIWKIWGPLTSKMRQSRRILQTAQRNITNSKDLKLLFLFCTY